MKNLLPPKTRHARRSWYYWKPVLEWDSKYLSAGFMMHCWAWTLRAIGAVDGAVFRLYLRLPGKFWLPYRFGPMDRIFAAWFMTAVDRFGLARRQYELFKPHTRIE